MKFFGHAEFSALHARAAQFCYFCSGLSIVIRRALHEGPLLGTQPNFAKPASCALLPLVNMRPMTAVSPKLLFV